MSENRILQQPPTLSPTYLIYGLPKAAAWLIRMLFAAVAAGLMYLTVRGITHQGSVYMIAFVGILAGVFCLVVLHPRSGRAVTYFLGDRHGMYFPASASHTLFSAPQADSWLHVPWQNISRIQSVKFNDTEHVAFSVADKSAAGADLHAEAGYRACRVGGQGRPDTSPAQENSTSVRSFPVVAKPKTVSVSRSRKHSAFSAVRSVYLPE